MMHKISREFHEHEHYFTPYYGDGLVNFFSEKELINFSILGGQFRKNTLEYLAENNLRIDLRGETNNYDLIYTCSDLIIPNNIQDKKIILVQEGMTDPETIMYHLVKKFNLPRYLASTSTTGLSNAYNKFCVASEGYKKLFVRKGANPDKIVVTGIPNFDNCIQYLHNNFPYKHYVLVATSDTRETFHYENRKRFILDAVKAAKGKKLIFKLHPNEKISRAVEEIKTYAPEALIFTKGKVEEMIANCDLLITKYSSVVYVGLALGKEVYSDFDIDELKQLTPVQNGGISARNIAQVGKEILSNKDNDGNVLYVKFKKYSKRLFKTKSLFACSFGR